MPSRRSGAFMRNLLLILSITLTSAAPAWPCQPPRPMRSKLVLVTAPDAVLPADGAILVRREQVPAPEDQPDVQWTVKDGSGNVLSYRVEDLGSGLERWSLPSVAEREIDIFDDAGKPLATLHQTAARGTTKLAAPVAKNFKSTLGIAEVRAFRMGTPGGTATLELGQDPPTDVRYLTIAVAGDGGFAHSAIELTRKQRKFETTSYSHKSCTSSGPDPVLVGQRIALTWIDALGRRSPAVQITVGRRR